ncbi:hypothetical protein IX49_07340 [Cellulophaga lytica]|uniref:hypothetical protein n=1 Tax=Cellulophaga lytica TaxID=979 RepID=UPI0004F7747D|nr:hypothetical protein [Cellulophaga lytica]AIM60344.1 hypothetical protein IX49_07325 [Cellulophaga lytica]AIM60347.1 hypothetical protein IX49_07340 [Cellulophaga lytica]
MSIKIKQALTESLTKIENKKFDEDTLRTLLITSREYLKHDGLIKELAHFIAHPKRNRGIFHKKVNSRYTKLKLVDEQLLKEQPDIKTEKELSDFMLGGIELEKIDSKLFNILYFDGLNDLPKNHLEKFTGFTKKQAEKFLKDNYTKKGNFHFINTLRNEKMISLLKELPNIDNDKKIQESIQRSEELIEKLKSGMNSLQKVIRGVIPSSSVFTTDSLLNDFQINFKKILSDFDIDSKYTAVITDNIQEILLCLMTLIHDSTFEFYDKNTARVYLCSYLEHNKVEQQSTDIKENIYDSGVLALYTNYKSIGKSNSFPLFVSEIKLKDYITREEFNKVSIESSICEIPWISAKQREGKLKLITYS